MIRCLAVTLIKGSPIFGISKNDFQFIEGLEVPRNYKAESGLESKIAGAFAGLSLLCLLIALLMILVFAPIITGNAIGPSVTNFYGLIFLVLSIFFGVNYFIFRRGKK